MGSGPGCLGDERRPSVTSHLSGDQADQAENDLADDKDELLPARLLLNPDPPGRLHVTLQPAWSPGYEKLVSRPSTVERPEARLLTFDAALGALAIYPLRTWPGSSFLKPKHPPFAEIVLEDWAYPLPQSPEEVGYLLHELPSGFIRDPAFGLGIDKEFWPILDAIRRVRGVTSLVMRNEGSTGPEGARFCMTYDDYDDVRRAMHRVTSRYRAEAKADRMILAHNDILTALDPQRFPAAKRNYPPGTVFKLLERRSDKSPLSRDDGRALVRTLTAAAPTLAKHPEELFALGETVEKVSLELLIAKFEEQLAKGGTEPVWQRLLDQNPFILSLVFGYPIVRLASQGAVGGWRLKGGAKIADYVVKNQLTHAIALVELKTPDTPLTGRDYRTGVPEVSPKLTGAVMQVLDQRLKLQKSLSLIKDEEDDDEVRNAEALGVDCIVIAGRTPSDRKGVKSFELFRNGLKDVRIFTFDELLAKTKSLLALLTPTPEGRMPLSEDDIPF
jgi:hypothetical protein